MTVALQIRDVPEEVRDALAQAAAARGQSMQSYLLDLVAEEARIAGVASIFADLAPHRVVIPAELDAAAIVREARDGGSDIERDGYS
jgi:plasmid stability protein